MNARAQIADRISIQVRKLGLRPGAHLPKHFAGEAFQSAFLAAMSTVFPDGERFFIDSVRHYRGQLQDPTLLAEVSAFIGQEAHHGREHESFNAWLEEHGYPVAPVLQRVRDSLDLARKNMSPRRQLAMTICLEHFTAILAHQMINDPQVSEILHPDIRELFMWHAVEETEHKAVAFDVYQALDGGYWNRVLTMLEVTFFFILEMMLITRRYLKAQGENHLSGWLRGMRWFWLKPGPMRRLIPDYLAWFRPGFHPWQHDNAALIRPWQQQFAASEVEARNAGAATS